MAGRTVSLDSVVRHFESLPDPRDTRDRRHPLVDVSAWASEQGFSLGQIATDEKSNEITAIPEFIDQIDIEDAVVTIDAMRCQKAIVKKSKTGGGDFVFAVKDNQPTLHQALQEFFESLLANPGPVSHRYHETHDTGHGRTDDRYYYLAPLPDTFACKKQRNSLHSPANSALGGGD